MTGPVDTNLLQAQMQGQDIYKRKLEMDSLRSRLGDSRSREQRLREACEGFESVFVQKLWKQMRSTVPKEGYLHSKDEEFWQGMFDKELAQKMTKAGGIGLSDMLYEQLQNKLDGAGRATAPSRVAEPKAVRELSPKDQIYAPVHQQDAEEDSLYTPVDAAGEEEGVGEFTQVSGEEAIPPAFDADDRTVYERVEQLARDLVSKAEAPASDVIPVKDETSADHLAGVAAVAEPASEASGVGGPGLRNPDMGMLDWPLPGRITSGFGWRNSPFTGEREWHAGVDIGGKIGDPIAAAWDGKVVFAGDKEGYGNLVVLEHAGGWRSYYGHASKIDVQVGDTVTSGNKIAEVGNTGRSTGPHLHFEIRQGELAWNPEQVRNRLMAGLNVGRQG